MKTAWGVQQGNIMSPMLFNIIMDLVLCLVQHQGMEGFGEAIKPNIHFYVDDKSAMGTDAKVIQQSLDTIIDTFSQIGI